MAGHRSGDPLTDRGIDRELAAALAVEPSRSSWLACGRESPASPNRPRGGFRRCSRQRARSPSPSPSLLR